MRKFCKSAVLTLSVGALFFASAETFVRGNLAGYYPNAEKRIVIMSAENIAGKSWSLKNEAGNAVASGNIGKSIEGDGDNSPFSYNFEVFFNDVKNEGNYNFAIDGGENFAVKITNNPYNGAIESVLRWLRVQRSGSNETLDRKPAHFGDSAAFVYYRDGDEKNSDWSEDEDGKTLDLLGGWYVGSDFTKSTGIAAYTTYYLLKAYNAAPESFAKKYSKSNLIDILDEAKFGLDYLMKVMPNDKDFIINVGGYDSDNGIRLPNEDIFDGKRVAYSIYSASDMGLTAAALAMGASTFKSIDAALADKFKTQAIKIFDKAASGEFEAEWLEIGWGLYPDETYLDNLLLAAGQLYQLTNEERFLSKAKEIGNGLEAAYWAGWEIQNMPAQALIADKNPASKTALVADLDGFLSSSRDNLWRLAIEYTSNGLYNNFVVGYSAGIYTKMFNDKEFSSLVIDMLNYNYGLNNWGVSFTSLPQIKQSVRRYNLAIYKLQTRLFPEGATAIGPADRETHDEESKWILDDVRVNYAYPFNTPAVVYLDHEHDYVTMDSRIDGAASNIYLMTLANIIFGGK